MVLAKSNRDIDQKDAIGNYDFTLTPRALFSPKGSFLTCSDKSKLIHVLRKLISEQTGKNSSLPDLEAVEGEDAFYGKKFAAVEGMIQKLLKSKNKKKTWLQCEILARFSMEDS